LIYNRSIGVGRADWFRPLPPPNRTCGSPASGSPVDGLPQRGLTVDIIGHPQAEQPMTRKVSMQTMPFASSDSVFQSRQHARCPDSRFGQLPSVASLSLRSIPGLLTPGHSFRGAFRMLGHRTSIFLRPLALPALPGFIATMDALTAESPVIRTYCPPDPVEGMKGANHRLERSLVGRDSDLPASRDRSSEHSVPNHRAVPAVAFAHNPSAPQAVRASSWERGLADRRCRNGFVSLRTARSHKVAFHPSSWRRSYFQLQAGVCVPEEDFHLSGRSRAQAHSPRRKPGPSVFNPSRCIRT